MVNGGVEVHDVSTPAKVATILSIEYRATARREHNIIHFRQITDCGRLTLAKPLLTLFLEDEGNIDAGARFHLIVTIDEGQVQGPCEMPAHGGLSRPHRSDKKDISGMFHSAIMGPLNRKPTRGLAFLILRHRPA